MRISLAAVIFAMVACGAPAEGPKSPTPPSGSGSSAKPSSPGDVSFAVPPIDIKGMAFEPEALGRPGMPLVTAKHKTTLDRQRKLVQKT
jgi:hypothetical protein